MDCDSSPESSDEVCHTQNNFSKPPRRDRSLFQLTTRFIGALRDSQDGLLDLNRVLEIWPGPKRRFYDITNVLEGIGVISKLSQSVVKWKGYFPGPHDQALYSKIIKFHSELKDLEQLESMLDQHTFWVEQSIKSTKEDCNQYPFLYLNVDDLLNCFPDSMLVAVRYSSHTRLHIPILRSTTEQSDSTDYQAYLKSINGPMDAVLMNKCPVTSTTVVLPFPPPENFGQSAELEMPGEGSGHSSQASGSAKRSNMLARKVIEEMRSLSRAAAQPNRTDAAELQNIAAKLHQIAQPTRELLQRDLLKELLSSEVLTPIYRLSSD
ncbi:transcription factor E2F4-like [Nelusetta ayraudi]|uniref:transcription factor E2F4-like n=1 Tax=Nelusetta ayraudi TaxID=303726 RepID=UPI003F6E4FE0